MAHQSKRKPVQLLPPFVAERIAAGEVIERPSSVVKELVENALDAGATEVAVILEAGGKNLIEVLDNGSGMSREDLRLCIQRHATSKLSTLDDLERLMTLGFRGEALPSVAAVSDLSILSRQLGAETAYELKVVEGGGSVPDAVTFGHFLGFPHGTRVRALGLFSQVPARLKFLKSQGAELSHVREWLERLALAHPSTGFRLVSDDRSILNLRPQEQAERVKSLLSDGEEFPLVFGSREVDKDLRVRAYWLQGSSSPQMRRLAQVINGRSVRDRLVQQAILSPFRQALMPGQFPAVAVFIDVHPGSVDVNVHPTKTEVRFLDSSRVFRAVQSLMESMISEHGAPAFAQSSAPPMWAPKEPVLRTQTSFFGGAPSSFTPRETSAPKSYHPQEWTAAEPASTEPASLDSVKPLLAEHLFAGRKLSGMVFNTYLLFDLGEELGLVDQHAAHERIRYERLRRRVTGARGDLPSQSLLLPEAVRFPVEMRSILEERIGLLEKLGFEAEIFGEDSMLFRAVPAEWGTAELHIRLKNLLERLLESEVSTSLAIDEALFESLASEACHSSIRAGDHLEEPEAMALVDQLFECEHPWNCPHGRPTVVRVPRVRFEEWFNRRV